MSEFQLNFNPFPSSAEEISAQQREALFNQLKQEDKEALEKFAVSHNKYIEQIILQEQEKNVPPKATFTELYDGAISALKAFALSSKSLEDFDKLFLWVIRQSVLKKLQSYP